MLDVFFNVAIKMNHNPTISCTELNQWRHAEFLYFRMNSSKNQYAFKLSTYGGNIIYTLYLFG